MKYAFVALLFFLNNEIISWIALLIMMVLFFADIAKARFG